MNIFITLIILTLGAIGTRNIKCSALLETCSAGLIEASMSTIGTKNIYYFGAHHEASTLECKKQQLTDFVEALKETEGYRQGTLHVLVEKPHFFFDNSVYDSLNKALKSSTVAITLEDAEIRHQYSEAADRIDKPAYYRRRETTSTYETFEDSDEDANEDANEEAHEYIPPVIFEQIEVLTFEHLRAEYNHWVAVLKSFRHKYSRNDLRFKDFDMHWKHMESDQKLLLEFLAHHNILLTHGIALTAESLQQNLKAEVAKKTIKQLNHLSHETFSYLFDLHLFKRIFEHPGENIAFVGGLVHITNVSGLFTIEGFNLVDGPCRLENPNGWFDSKKDPKFLKLLSKDDMIAVLKGRTASYYLEKASKIIAHTPKIALYILTFLMICIKHKYNQLKQRSMGIVSLDSSNKNAINLEVVDKYLRIKHFRLWEIFNETVSKKSGSHPPFGLHRNNKLFNATTCH